MNILLYGIAERQAAAVADRYGFTLCRTFEQLDTENNRILLLPPLADEQAQLRFLKQMERYDTLIDAVVAAHRTDAFSTVCYAAQAGKFYSVDDTGDCPPDDGPAPRTPGGELDRIVAAHLGLICAHEGI